MSTKIFLNLSSRPFRNERLPRVLYGALWSVLVLATVLHGVFAFRLRSARTQERRAETARLEAKLQRMIARESKPASRVEAATLVRWAALRELVDQRSFSWTLLLSELEPLVPPGVRIISLTPKVLPDGWVSLELTVVARSPEQVLEFVTALERQPQFEEVYPLTVDDDQGQRRATYSMLYAARILDTSAAARQVPQS